MLAIAFDHEDGRRTFYSSENGEVDDEAEATLFADEASAEGTRRVIAASNVGRGTMVEVA